MLNSQKEPLFKLIKSLSKSEKRQFKLFVGRLEGNTNAKFLSLFSHLDKSELYDEQIIIKKGIVSKQQLSNLKANLYKQILKSLRLNPAHKNIRVLLREQLDYATILYNKGLYNQSLKVLEKAKTTALEYEEKNLAYEIVELEKVIETQYITRSIASRADELAVQAKELSKLNVIASKLSNLSLQLYGLLLKVGYVKNEEDYSEVTEYYQDRMPKYNFEELSFREKLWLYKAKLWYSFLIQDFLLCYKYANKWVMLFSEYPKMIEVNPVFYLKGQHYLLESLFLIKHQTQFEETLDKLEENLENGRIIKNDNTETLGFVYLYTNKMNAYFLKGAFKEGLVLVDEVEALIEKYKNRLDQHHIMLFYYKIGCLFFGAGNNKSCIEYLGRIINNKELKGREDLMCFSRILNLVAHYEEGLDFNLEKQLKSTYRFLLKMNDLHQVQKEMLQFLREVTDIYPHQIKKAFKNLHTKLKVYEDHPYERRAFLYLDILSWLESKIEGKPVDKIIQEKSKVLLR
ncbi:hypothetical protein [Pseudofulvibacter geojedonensis]|uniref:Tetratricopeptide repeat protein n=1 Tax=Pseudofulvibacter geojedonensis TaxID=1123758 RepID=A0ABW3I658_9FLAO